MNTRPIAEILNNAEEQAQAQIKKATDYQNFMKERLGALSLMMPQFTSFLKSKRMVLHGVQSAYPTGSSQSEVKEDSKLIVNFTVTSTWFAERAEGFCERVAEDFKTKFGYAINVNQFSFRKDQHTDPVVGNKIIVTVWM